jgi:hypothetical protein
MNQGWRFGVMVLSAVATAAVVGQDGVRAQGRGRGAQPPGTARASAPFDVTGYWVAVITEDWKYRMVTPKVGVFDAIPLSAEGRKVGMAWSPDKDQAAGEACKAYGAAGIMRMPTRLNIAWQDANTLKVDTDAGTQTRLFHFGAAAPKPGEPTWQGHSVAEWEGASGRGATRTGNLKVVTTNLKSGYVRRNGAPYSDRTTVTEWWDVNTLPNGDRWLTVTTKVEDPVYLTRAYITTSDFKKLPDATGWSPSPCATK